MSQYGDYEKAIAGLKASLNSHADTVAAKTPIQFGSLVFGKYGEEGTGYGPDKLTLVLSANFVTGNVINGTVDGVAFGPVNFTTDHATTFAALVTAIDNIPGVSVANSNATTRKVDVSVVDKDLSLTLTVTGGASQPTASFEIPADRFLRGVACFIQKQKTSEALGARYEKTEAVSVLREGKIWVVGGASVQAGQGAAPASAGRVAGVASGISGTKFDSNTTLAGELAILSLNLA